MGKECYNPNVYNQMAHLPPFLPTTPLFLCLSPFSFTKDIHQEEGEAQEDGVSEKEMRFLGWGRGD